MDDSNEFVGIDQPLKLIIPTGIDISSYTDISVKIKNINSTVITIFSPPDVEMDSTDHTIVNAYIDGGFLEEGRYIGQVFVYFTDPVNPYPGRPFVFTVSDELIITLLERVKSEAYIGITHNNHDSAIQTIVDGIILSAIDYMDDEDITQESEIPEGIIHRLLKQVAYEYRRRKDSGLSSVVYPDGSVSKFSIDEWLPDVKDALNRHKVYTL